MEFNITTMAIGTSLVLLLFCLAWTADELDQRLVEVRDTKFAIITYKENLEYWWHFNKEQQSSLLKKSDYVRKCITTIKERDKLYWYLAFIFLGIYAIAFVFVYSTYINDRALCVINVLFGFMTINLTYKLILFHNKFTTLQKEWYDTRCGKSLKY